MSRFPKIPFNLREMFRVFCRQGVLQFVVASFLGGYERMALVAIGFLKLQNINAVIGRQRQENRICSVN